MVINIKLDEVMFKNGKLKVADLVRLTGLNKNTLYALEKGDIKRIDLDTINSLCKALACNVADLMEYIED